MKRSKNTLRLHAFSFWVPAAFVCLSCACSDSPGADGQQDASSDSSTPDALPLDAALEDGGTTDAGPPPAYWAVSAGGWDGDEAGGIVVDDQGNVYVAGTFGHEAYFGEIRLTTASYPDSGYKDLFVAKLSPWGEFVWAVTAGGTMQDYGTRIALDGSGGLYVVGSFQDMASFGEIELVSSGDYDVYVARLSSDGEFLWADSIGGPGLETGHSVAVDGSGAVYVLGDFKHQFTFAGQVITAVADDMMDVFIAKYSPDRTPEWAVMGGGPLHVMGRDLSVAANGDVLGIGTFQGEALFGDTLLQAQGAQNVFVTRLIPTGQFLWTRQGGGALVDYGTAVTTDSTGNAYFSGCATGDATFGAYAIEGSSSDCGLFLAKLDPGGDFLWASSAGGPATCSCNRLGIDEEGNLYVGGFFRESFIHGSTVLSSAGSGDVLVAVFTPDGSPLWAVSAGGPGTDSAIDLVIGTLGDLYLMGSFDHEGLFGSTTLSAVELAASDVFVWKLPPP